MRRLVLDPGVLVSALVSGHGPPARLLDRWREGAFDLVVSPRLLTELAGVLTRPKFRLILTEREASEFVSVLAREAVTIDDPASAVRLTRDPDDDYLVALAQASSADFVVSGDRDLVELAGVDPPVLRPRNALERVHGD